MASQIRLKNNKPKKWITLGILTGLVFLLSFFYACNQSKNASETAYLNHADDVAYVGIETCASCHQDKHSTFVHTGMGLSFDTASKSKSLAVFGAEHKVYDASLDMYYYPFWQDNQLYIKEYQLEGNDTIHQLNVAINYIVGSGQHTNSHLFTNNGFVYQAPITFYVQQQKWDLAPGFENGNNSRFSRILNVECLSCHNAMPKMQGNSDFQFASIGKGIDCERCHGPGELHVKQRKVGEGVDVKKAIDPTIVNPRKLTWERQIDLCQRCHLQGLNVLKEGKKFTDFKPGMQLSDVFEIYLPEYEGNDGRFDMANHSQRLQMSACFIKSNSNNLSFTCITCHNPHISVKQTGKGVYNAACNQCHQTQKCSAPAETLEKAKNDCVSCHMPQSGSEDIPHVTVHDHYIRKPQSKKNVEQAQKLIGLYAVNNPNPEPYYQTKAYLEYWEKFDKNPFWLQRAEEMVKATDFPNLKLKYYYLTEKYNDAIQLKLDEQKLTAWEFFMLGEANGKTNRNSQAIYYLQQSLKKDPTLPVVSLKLIKYYLKQQKNEEALHLATSLKKQFSTNGEVSNLLAKSLIALGRIAESQQYMLEALQLEPQNLEVWELHFNYYILTGDKQNASSWAKKILKKHPKHKSKDDFLNALNKLT